MRVARDGEEVLARYDLSDRERRRLVAVSRQPGMSTTCTLYRVNRITPLYTLLPLSSFLLGERLLPEAERYWAEFPGSDLQFKYEVERFGGFLKRRLHSGDLEDPFLEEVLTFEMVATALRYAPRRGPQADLVGVVRFRHDPTVILALLTAERRPPDDLPEGEFDLVLDARGEELELQVRARGAKRLDPVAGAT